MLSMPEAIAAGVPRQADGRRRPPLAPAVAALLAAGLLRRSAVGQEEELSWVLI